MFPSVLECLLLLLLCIPSESGLEGHRQFQYNSQIDGRGTYNFAYDTSHQPQDAHSLHMEYRDANGIVRGRYGYTDPRGKLRIVEYEAGPDGYKARGDVGPDLFPHMEAPGLSPQKPDPVPTPLRVTTQRNPINARVVTENEYYSSYSPAAKRPQDPDSAPTPLRVKTVRNPLRERVVTENEYYSYSPALKRLQNPDSAPTPLRMAGWDPKRNPINERVVTENEYYSYSPAVRPRRVYARYSGRNQAYRGRTSYSPVSQTAVPDVEIFQQEITTNEKKSKPLTQSQPLTIYNIDVDPDEIRIAGPPVGSAESRSSTASFEPAYRRRDIDIITTSPELTYYERSPRRRMSQINHYHNSDSYPRQRVGYYSDGQRIQRPRQVRYDVQSHNHGQQYNFD